MTLEALGGGGFDYVQDTAPSSPSIGETWYDESEADVTDRSKIYADVGNGAEWVVVPSLEQNDILSDGTPFDGANIDQPVSDVEAAVNALNDLAQSDILSDGTPFRGDAVPDSGTIPNTDQVGQGVDWSSKTPDQVSVSAGGDTQISGSGYLVAIIRDAFNSGSGQIEARVDVDGNFAYGNLAMTGESGDGISALPLFPTPFESSLTVTESAGNNDLRVAYLLD